MFPTEVPDDIRNCVRVFPHDQNTGGFFVALFQKTGPIKIPRTPVPQEEIKVKTGGNKFYTELDDTYPQYLDIKNAFGYDCKPTSQLFTLADSNMKSIFYVSSEVKDYIESDKRRSLRVLSLGAKAFLKHGLKNQNNICLYKPVQDGLTFVSKHFSRRKVFLDDLEFLRALLTQKFLILSEEKSLIMQELGFYVINFTHINEEIIVLRGSENKIIPLIPKEHEDSLKMRYTII